MQTIMDLVCHTCNHKGEDLGIAIDNPSILFMEGHAVSTKGLDENNLKSHEQLCLKDLDFKINYPYIVRHSI